VAAVDRERLPTPAFRDLVTGRKRGVLITRGEHVRDPLRRNGHGAAQAHGLLKRAERLRRALAIDPRAIAEIHRVLADDGRMLSLDFNKPANGLVRAVYLAYLTVVGSALGFALHGDPNTYRYIPESIRLYPGAAGVAEGQNLPDRWNGETGENVLWKTAVAGLAHSSPIVWRDRIFVTSAVSSRGGASFRPGLYGDGDASDDRSSQKWTLLAIDKHTGARLWERVAFEGVPVDKRHVKSTYASATPATDGRIVVASFGSQGVYAYDVEGNFLWKVDPGRLNLGAYDIPTFEWGPASSPIIWRGVVFLQCDTQNDSFLLALDVESGETLWKESLPIGFIIRKPATGQYDATARMNRHPAGR